jgi:hypothetical protein
VPAPFQHASPGNWPVASARAAAAADAHTWLERKTKSELS